MMNYDVGYLAMGCSITMFLKGRLSVCGKGDAEDRRRHFLTCTASQPQCLDGNFRQSRPRLLPEFASSTSGSEFCQTSVVITIRDIREFGHEVLQQPPMLLVFWAGGDIGPCLLQSRSHGCQNEMACREAASVERTLVFAV